MKKWICSLILAAAVMLTLGIAVSALDVSLVSPDMQFAYKVNEDGVSATITEYRGDGGDVVIPEKIGKYTVTKIGNSAFEDCWKLTSITFPDNLISIGANAFVSCNRLTSVTFSDSVTSIGSSVFYNCDGLINVTFPDSVTSIESTAFANCDRLTNVYFYGDVPLKWGSVYFGFPVFDSTVIIHYLEGNTSGWTSPTWIAPDGFIYNTQVIPNSSPSQDQLRELYVEQHIEYINEGTYEEDIIPGFDELLLCVMQDVKGDWEVNRYDTVNFLNNILRLKIDAVLDKTDEYEFLLAQILCSSTAQSALQELYYDELSEVIYEILEVILSEESAFVNLLEETGQLELLNELISKGTALQKATESFEPWSKEYSNAYSDFISSLSQTNKIKLKDIGNDFVGFAISTGLDLAAEGIENLKDLVQYVAIGEAYIRTSDTFRDVLNSMLFTINPTLTSPSLSPYQVSWENLIEANVIDADMFELANFSSAIGNFINSMDAYKNTGSSTIAKGFLSTGKLLSDTAEDTKNVLVQNIAEEISEVLISQIPVVGKLTLGLKTLLSIDQLLTDNLTNIDERAYCGAMLANLYCISYVLDHAIDWLLDGDEVPWDDEFQCALKFDQAVKIYKSIIDLAADYGMIYEEYRLNTAISKYNISWHSTAISLMATEKLLCAEIQCHSPDLVYDEASDTFLYNTDELSVYSINADTADISVYDADNNQIALFSSEGNIIVEQYQHYLLSCESNNVSTNIIVIPKDYTISISGKASGTIDVYTANLTGITVKNMHSFVNVPVTDKTSGNIRYDSSMKILMVGTVAYFDNTPPEPEPDDIFDIPDITIIPGDVNWDMKVTPEDYSILIDYFSGQPVDVTITSATADLNDDGRVTRADAMILARCLAEWPGYAEKYLQ